MNCCKRCSLKNKCDQEYDKQYQCEIDYHDWQLDKEEKEIEKYDDSN